MDKDKLGNELRLIMEEETKDIEISPGLMDKILLQRKRTWKEKISDFLNKEVEIPLIPVVASLALGLMIISIPKDLMVNKNIKVIDLGSSQIIVREDKGVSRND